MEERTLRPQDLYRADEVFISSTNRNLVAVSEINGHKMPVGTGPIMQKLEKSLLAYVREYMEARTAVSGKL